jgi:hypothetical protein
MKSMYIGSGDVTFLMAGLKTKSQANLLKRFVSGEIPYYNAKASPIDALRTGAILEDRYQLILSDDYYPQKKEVCSEMDVFKASIDFAKVEGGKTVDFDELKTCSFNDFFNFEEFKNDNSKGVDYIKKKYKNNYRQVQQQLLCSGLDSCNIVFLAVYTYEDEVNYSRNIKTNEYIKFRINRDDEVIKQIKKRGEIFQQIKDYYEKV